MIKHLMAAAVLSTFPGQAGSGETDSLKNYLGWDDGISVKRRVFGQYLMGATLWSDFNKDENEQWENRRVEWDTLPQLRYLTRLYDYHYYRCNLSLQKEKRISGNLFLNPFIQLGYSYTMYKRRWEDPYAPNQPFENQETHGLHAVLGVEPTLQVMERVFISTKIAVASAKTWSEGHGEYNSGGAANTVSYTSYNEVIGYRYIGPNNLLSMQIAAHFAFH